MPSLAGLAEPALGPENERRQEKEVVGEEAEEGGGRKRREKEVGEREGRK